VSSGGPRSMRYRSNSVGEREARAATTTPTISSAHTLKLSKACAVSIRCLGAQRRRVSVVGIQSLGRPYKSDARSWPSGVWNFLSPIERGAVYKYEIIGPSGKHDPLKAILTIFRAELRPQTGSVVANWTPTNGMTPLGSPSAPKPIWFENYLHLRVHLGAWRRSGRGQPLAHLSRTRRSAYSYVKDLGYSHIALLPLWSIPSMLGGYQTRLLRGHRRVWLSR